MQQNQVDIHYDTEQPTDDEMELNFGIVNAAYHNALGFDHNKAHVIDHNNAHLLYVLVIHLNSFQTICGPYYKYMDNVHVIARRALNAVLCSKVDLQHVETELAVFHTKLHLEKY